MKLYQIVLPHNRNDGEHDYTKELRAFEDYVLDVAGGITRGADCYGYWHNPAGIVMADRSVPYQIAATPTAFSSMVAKAFELFDDQAAIFYAELGDAHILLRSAIPGT